MLLEAARRRCCVGIVWRLVDELELEARAKDFEERDKVRRIGRSSSMRSGCRRGLVRDNVRVVVVQCQFQIKIVLLF